jgi:hypothetical protein
MDSCIVVGLSKNNQQDATLQQNLVFHLLLKAQHVSSSIPLIIRSSNCICGLWFTYACGVRPWSSLSGNSDLTTAGHHMLM